MRLLARLLPTATRAFTTKTSQDPKFLNLAIRMLNKKTDTIFSPPVRELAARLSTLSLEAFRVLEVIHTTFKPKSHDS